LQFIWDDPNTAGATQDGFGENFTIKFDAPGKFFVNLTVTDDDGKSSTASVLVDVKAKPAEGLFGMTTPTVVGAALALVITILLVMLLLRGRESDTVPIETKQLPDYGWQESPPAIATTPALVEPVAAVAEPINTGPPIPASGLPEGWTMEQWSYYGEQYLANLPPAPIETYSQPVQPTYQEQPTAPAYTPEPATTVAEPAPSLLDKTMVQEPAPTPASQP